MDVYFYYISPDYIEHLKAIEHKKRGFTCVPNVQYGLSKKFTYGAVMNINGINYFVPVSSYNKQQKDLMLLKDKKDNKVLGSLRFNYMIPVPLQCVKKVDINSLDENKKVKTSKELAFCRRNRDAIPRKAAVTYERVNRNIQAFNSGDKKLLDEDLYKNSCDFKLLENAYIIYCHDNDLPLSEELQKKYAEITGEQPPKKTAVANQTSAQESEKPQGFSFSVAEMKRNVKRVHEKHENDSVPAKQKNKNNHNL